MGRGFCFGAWRKVGFAAWLLLSVTAARGQVGEAYVNLTDISIKEYSNAVMAVIHTDGAVTIHFDWDSARINGQLALGPTGNWDYTGKRWHSYVFWAVPMRSRLASGIIKVDKYPLSYIEIKPEPPYWVQADDRYKGKPGVTITFETFDDIDFKYQLDYADMTAGFIDSWQSSNGQDMYVLFKSGRQLPRGSAAPPQEAFAKSVKPELQVSAEPEGLTLSALNTSLQDLAQELSRVTGESISVANGTSERISLFLRRQSLDQVLTAVEEGYGLVLTRDEAGYHLGEAAAVADDGLPGEEAIYSARYLKARQLRSFLPNFLLPYTRVDDQKNIVSFSGSRPMIQQALAQLRQVDKPAPNLLVEMTAVEFTSRQEAESALALARSHPDWQLTVTLAPGDISFTNLGEVAKNFRARLQALVTEGKAQIRAKKQLRLMSGEKGEIFAGQTRDIIIEYTSGGNVKARVEEVAIGAKLNVTATAGGGEELRLTLNPEVINLVEIDPRSRQPVVGVRSAAATLRVKEGEMIAVGGIKLQQEQKKRREIPFLGRLPLLGPLFRARQDHQEQTETMFFVSARREGDQERGASWDNAAIAR
jgi:protein transport protein HofQ/type IV pilus assembly protein PilQ